MSRTKGNNGSKGSAETGPTSRTMIFAIQKFNEPHTKNNIKLLAWPSFPSFIHPYIYYAQLLGTDLSKRCGYRAHQFMLSNQGSRHLGATSQLSDFAMPARIRRSDHNLLKYSQFLHDYIPQQEDVIKRPFHPHFDVCLLHLEFEIYIIKWIKV